MYDSWYINRFDDHCDTFYKDYEIFGYGREGTQHSLSDTERLDADEVLEWLGKGTDPRNHGRFRIL